MVYPLRPVRTVPAFSRGDEFPAAGAHGDAVDILLYRLGPGVVPGDRWRRSCARAASFRRTGHIPLFRPARVRAGQVRLAEPQRLAQSRNRPGGIETAVEGVVRAGLDGADDAGLARLRRPPEMVLQA